LRKIVHETNLEDRNAKCLLLRMNKTE
jgi:hypothetical protein